MREREREGEREGVERGEREFESLSQNYTIPNNVSVSQFLKNIYYNDYTCLN